MEVVHILKAVHTSGSEVQVVHVPILVNPHVNVLVNVLVSVLVNTHDRQRHLFVEQDVGSERREEEKENVVV
jgi:hypothetical protein